MKRKMLIFLVLVCFGLGVFVVQGFSATAWQRTKLRHICQDNLVDAPGFELHRAPYKALSRYTTLGLKYQANCENINPEAGTVVEHDQIGDTWYDFQQNESMGRMISVTNNGYRHFSWMFCDHPYPPGPRYVDANCRDPLGNYIGQVHADGGDVNAGYSNQTHLHDGTSVVIYHRTAGSPEWYTSLTLDSSVCSGLFERHWDIPDYITGQMSDNPGIWPKAEVMYDAMEDRDYIHILHRESAAVG